MEPLLLLFLLAVALGSYVQAVTGFALGIFVLGAVAVLHINTIAVAVTALNIMTLCNASVVILPRMRVVHWRIVAITLAGLMPAMVVGVLALGYLSEHSRAVLRLLLGLLIVAGGFVLIWRPRPRRSLSRPASFIATGLAGGLLGGLFSVPAPPLVYQLYRQPLSVATVRSTLIALFALFSIGRLIAVGLDGQIDSDVLRMGLLAIPVVAVSSWIGNHYPPPFSDTTMRRGVFMLLIVTGLFIMATAPIS